MVIGRKYVIFDTPAGWIGIVGTSKGLSYVTLPRRSEAEARRALGKTIEGAVNSPELFREVITRFKAYFNGQPVSFSDQLDLSPATEFQRSVWRAARLIPYGETRSYSWIAEQIKKPAAARAVGQALGANPLPIIIPCHRVLARDGGLGGFSGGLKVKRQLLKLEGVVNVK